MPARCPVRLLVPGDLVRLTDGTQAQITGAYSLPGKVELCWLDDGCRVDSAVFAPDAELLVIRTAAEVVAS